jgi:hypothetical protein
MTLPEFVLEGCRGIQILIALWVGWRFFRARDAHRWKSAGISFGVATVFLLNAATAAADVPLDLFRAPALPTIGLSLFVCGLWLGIALFTRDHGKPAG